MEETQAVAVFNEEMETHAEESSRPQSVMNSIHEVKAYNANPKIWTLDEALAWKFKIKKAYTWDIEYIDSGFKFNPLAICKVKSWLVYLLDEFWMTLHDEEGKEIERLFYTNELSIYTKKTDTIAFKWNWQIIWYYQKWDFDKMLKTRKIQLMDENGNRSEVKDNPFYKTSTDQSWKPYADTFISDTYVMYWVFVWGKFDWEYFKMYLNLKAFGKTFEILPDGTFAKTAPNEWSLLYQAYWPGLEAWNKMREVWWKAPVQSIWTDQLDLICKTEEMEIWDKVKKKIYATRFDFHNLVGYRWSNIADINYIKDLQNQYFMQEFQWMKQATEIVFENNWSVAVFTGNVKMNTDKQLKASDEVTPEVAQKVFDNPDTERVHTEAQKWKAPF